MDAISNLVYTAVTRYFNSLANTGYQRQSNVNKLLALIAIQEVLSNDFRGIVTEEDYEEIGKALYCLYGSNCLIPYPDYYNCKSKKIMYLGSISELAARVAALENGEISGTGINFPVVVPDDSIPEDNPPEDDPDE